MDDFGKAEDIMILGLIVLVGYGLYKFSASFGCTVNQIFGLPCAADQSTAPGGSYASAANQVVTSPGSSLESILGIGPAYPSQPTMIGSTPVDNQTVQTGIATSMVGIQ